jgi:hypothetical protein
MAEKVKWAYSTVNTLRQCNRKYYFSQVLATHGRKVPVRRKAYELKNMQNLTMWKGTVVDKFMETVIIPAIIEKEELDFETLAEQAVQLAKAQFEFSKFQMYADPSLTKSEVEDQFCILDVHELDKGYSEDDLIDTYKLIKQSIFNIPIIKMPDGKLLIDFLKGCNGLTPNVNNWQVEVEKARVKPQMDLIAISNWKPVVIDWKLSESYTSDYSRQLVICGLTIYLKRLENQEKKNYEYSDIKLYEVNLLKGIVREHEFSENKVNELIDYINLTSGDIDLLTDTSSKEIDIEDFELTDDEGLCKFCNYRSLCSFLLINNNKYDEKSYAEFVQSNELV